MSHASSFLYKLKYVYSFPVFFFEIASQHIENEEGETDVEKKTVEHHQAHTKKRERMPNLEAQ